MADFRLNVRRASIRDDVKPNGLRSALKAEIAAKGDDQKLSPGLSSDGVALEERPGRKSIMRIGQWLAGQNAPKRKTFTSAEQVRRLWTGATKLIRDIGDTVISVAISGDDMFFAAGGTNKQAIVYSTSDGSTVASFTLAAGINALALNGLNDDMKLFAGTFGGLVCVYDVTQRREMGSCKFGGHDDKIFGAVLCLGVSAQGQTLAVGGASNNVCVFSVEYYTSQEENDFGERLCRMLPNHIILNTMGVVLTLSIDDRAELLVTGGESKVVEFWSIGTMRTGKKFPRLAKPDNRFICASTVHSIALNRSGTTLAVGTSEVTEVYEVSKLPQTKKSGKSRSSQRVFEVTPSTWFNVSAAQGGVALSDSSTNMLAVGGNQLLSVYSISNGGAIRQMPRDGRVRCVALSNDGTIVVAGGFDKKVTLNLVEGGAHLFNYSSDLSATVRSVHLSRDSSLMAVGLDGNGKGYVELYDLHSDDRLFQHEHAKAVWCVRISPDGQTILAAGYDMKVSVYDSVKKIKLQEISYVPRGGPAFIWSMSFSQDGKYIAVGNWNRSVYVYATIRSGSSLWSWAAQRLYDVHNILVRRDIEDNRVSQSSEKGSFPGARTSFVASPLPMSPTPPKRPKLLASGAVHLSETYEISRSDRVYAVALDASGRFVVIGGRDKAVVMYDIQGALRRRNAHGERDANRSGWASNSTDADDDLDLPMDDAVVVWEHNTDDFIYTVSLTADMQYCAYGGTAKRVVVVDGRTGNQLLKIGASGTVWSTSLLQEPPRLVYGGELASLTVVDLETYKEEVQLPVGEPVYAISVTPDSVCYTDGKYASLYGKPGVHYSWQDQPSYMVVSQLVNKMASTEEKLLQCVSLILEKHPTAVNLRDPLYGTSLIQFVIRDYNLPTIVQALLHADCKIGLAADRHEATALNSAVRQGKWRSLQQLLDALLEGRFGMNPRTMELVMQCFETMAVRYPRDLLHLITNIPLDPEPEVMQEDCNDVMLPHMLVIGSSSRCPRGIWDAKIAQYRNGRNGTDSSPADQSDSDWTSKSTRSFKTLLVNIRTGTGNAIEQARATLGETSRNWSARSKSGKSSPGILHKLNKRRANGLPSSSTNDLDVDSEVSTVSESSGVALQKSKSWKNVKHQLSLSVNKVRRPTSLGMSRALGFLNAGQHTAEEQIPEGFCKQVRGGLTAMRVPFGNFAGYIENNSGTKISPLQLIIEAASATNDFSVFGSKPIEIMLQLKWNGFAFRGFLKSLAIFCVHLVVGTVYNLAISERVNLSIDNIVGVDGHMAEVGLILGWCWTTCVSLALQTQEINQLRSAGLRSYLLDYNNVLDQVFINGQMVINILFWVRDGPESAIWSSGRTITRFNGTGDETITTEKEIIGVFLTMQALVLLALYLRLVTYLRGFLALGALIHMIVQVFVEIIPFMSLLLIATMGFSFSLRVLLQHTEYGQPADDPELQQYNSISSSIFLAINMGFYSTFRDVPVQSHWQVLCIFEVFMICVQIVLLNLLIAIMSETHERMRNVSKLVAHFERAKLVLEEEQKLPPAVLVGQEAPAKDRSKLKNGVFGLVRKMFASPHFPLEQVAPRWLHVLLPAEMERKDDGDSEELKKIITLESLVAHCNLFLEASNAPDFSISYRLLRVCATGAAAA